ncbi:hypothetical protein AAVH_29088 [Aphelenchoides avenae]|nr:hypothetical protein AAVH_29088 [Aphelenchus avenae]
MPGPRKPAQLWKDYPRLVRECAEGVFEELAKKTKCDKAERKEGVCDGVVAVLIEGADVNEVKKELSRFSMFSSKSRRSSSTLFARPRAVLR